MLKNTHINLFMYIQMYKRTEVVSCGKIKYKCIVITALIPYFTNSKQTNKQPNNQTSKKKKSKEKKKDLLRHGLRQGIENQPYSLTHAYCFCIFFVMWVAFIYPRHCCIYTRYVGFLLFINATHSSHSMTISIALLGFHTGPTGK